MYHGKPIIGIVGGIGSGKTFVARLFGEMGCMVIEADALVREAYLEPRVLRTLREWWGDEVFAANGSLDRAAVARKVFANPKERTRLERLIHPWVDDRRREMMAAAGDGVIAFVWDTPLLLEAGLHKECDAIVYVEAPEAERMRRVMGQRGWDSRELSRRENLQMGLDKKREISDHVIVNTAGGDQIEASEAGNKAEEKVKNASSDARVRSQVREILTRIVAGLPERP
jgi:dephospho-CoA kinase